MLFRLPNIVSLILCLVVTTRASAQSFTPEPFAYRGLLSAFDNVSIRSWAIREDGRYLAYSSGGSSFTLLDLQDGVTKSTTAVATSSPVLALFFESKVRLYAVTKAGIQFFDMTKPFAPVEENTDFDIEDSARGTPIDACVDSSKNVYYLETSDSLDQQVVRVVANKTPLREIDWRNIFPSNSSEHTPVGLRCLISSVLVISSRVEDDRERVALANVAAAGSITGRIELADSYINHDVVDLHPSADKNSILVMLAHRSATGRDTDDAGAVLLPATLTPTTIVNLGSDPRNLAIFLDRSSPMVGFFMGKDLLEDSTTPPTHQLLSIAQTSFGGTPDFGDRGVGTSLAGGFTSRSRSTSDWIFTDKDPYAYGIMAATGVSRISRAPALELVEGLSSSDVSESSTLSFKIRSPVASRYEIYSELNRDQEGTQNGLSDTPGTRIEGGSLAANGIQTIEIPISDLKITKIGKYSLVIRSQALDKPESDVRFPWARLGVGFQFNPDPLPVTKLRLGFGDESVTVFFWPQDPVVNISHYYLYFSTDPSDLANLPSSESELESSAFAAVKKQIPRMDSGFFESPIRLNAATWPGSYRLGPIRNDQTVYFRVQVVSATGKFSSANDAAIGLAPKSTKSLSQAFGSNVSCQLVGAYFSSYSFCLIWMAMILIGLLFIRNKKRACE